ncbi:Crp/Fnr family transcriptional regulator [Pedobacter psychroterrae]|uniref:Crp/Fnr family transcriptional regulator n=1 Tax=Pedobacter psychroterrae TaxID=2530453 RepID=A0A4R0NN96_9SPHI|nr:Crp/Fnr family transcriptional regulator [Pedobacter psychroterrae]TCD01418.1 Crp/Fnr family transcriptional regulator [Pedobacter psychroterrae]
MITKYLISKGFKITPYSKGEVIYSPGAHPRAVYFIKTGKVRMVTVNEEGKEFIQGIFKANEYFGEPALLLSKPYLAYTIADQPAEIIIVSKDEFLKLLEEVPGFNMQLIQNLSSRLFYKSMMLEELANEQAGHRVITLLKYLMKDLEQGAELNFTRQQLADMSGLRVETVIRIIKNLSGQHSFKLLKGKIIKTSV